MKLLNRLSTSQLFVIITGIYLTGYVFHALYLGKTVYGDGRYYYAWLTSLTPSKYAIGPALLWSPVYSMIQSEIAVGLVGVLATIFSLILLYNLLTKFYSGTISLMSIAAIAGATNLLFYGSLDTVNSHAASFFAITLFLTFLSTRKQWFLVGLSLGLVSLMRLQDVVFGLLLLPYLSKKNLLRILSGVLLMFIPQLFAWKLFSGNFWLNPYLMHEFFDFLHPHIFEVLFNTTNGLFLWTPMTAIGFVGLFLSKRYFYLSVFLIEVFLVASWSTWWQGASYSGRMFVSSLPLLLFGIAAFFKWLSSYNFTKAHYLLTLIIPLSLINVTSIIYFLITLK